MTGPSIPSLLSPEGDPGVLDDGRAERVLRAGLCDADGGHDARLGGNSIGSKNCPNNGPQMAPKGFLKRPYVQSAAVNQRPSFREIYFGVCARRRAIAGAVCQAQLPKQIPRNESLRLTA